MKFYSTVVLLVSTVQSPLLRCCSRTSCRAILCFNLHSYSDAKYSMLTLRSGFHFFIQKIRNTYHSTGNYKGTNIYSLQFSIWSHFFRVIFIKLRVFSTLNVAYHSRCTVCTPSLRLCTWRSLYVTVHVRFHVVSEGVGIDRQQNENERIYFV